MGKDRNPISAVNAPPLNAFPANCGFREKEKENDLAAVIIKHFAFYSGCTNENKHAP